MKYQLTMRIIRTEGNLILFPIFLGKRPYFPLRIKGREAKLFLFLWLRTKVAVYISAVDIVGMVIFTGIYLKQILDGGSKGSNLRHQRIYKITQSYQIIKPELCFPMGWRMSSSTYWALKRLVVCVIFTFNILYIFTLKHMKLK